LLVKALAKTFTRYFPAVFSYASGALVLLAFIDRALVGSWKKSLLRSDPSTLLSCVFSILVLAVSWTWLVMDFSTREDEGRGGRGSE
jgi:hypothetical protein